MTSLRIPAVYMRGGTSKGVFFRADALPEDPQLRDDWSGNCGNLTAAVGPFTISDGLVEAPREGTAVVRIWQANIGKRIIAHVPVQDGEVVEEGDFELDGVTFPAAEIQIEFLDPGGMEGDKGWVRVPADALAVTGVDLTDPAGSAPSRLSCL